jgi:hypothetical protein
MAMITMRSSTATTIKNNRFWNNPEAALDGPNHEQKYNANPTMVDYGQSQKHVNKLSNMMQRQK